MIGKVKRFLCMTVLVLLLTFTVSAKVQLSSMDEITETTGGVNVEVVTAASEHIEGKGALRSSSDSLLIVEVSFTPTDIEAYAMDGGLHFWLYLEDADALDGNGQIELTSSGTCDIEETHWFLYDFAYEDGWNEIWFPFYTCETDEMNYAACNYFRIYNFLYYDTYMIVDDISIGMREDFPTLDSQEKPDDTLLSDEKETQAPLVDDMHVDNGNADYGNDDSGIAGNDDDYAGVDGEGAIEDRIEEEETTGNDPMLYVGVVVFSAVAVIATGLVVFSRLYREEDAMKGENRNE